LLERDAGIDAQDMDGNTPLMLAVMSADTAAVELLLEKGADVSIQNRDGKTALRHAKAALIYARQSEFGRNFGDSATERRIALRAQRLAIIVRVLRDTEARERRHLPR
jgi:hypothetical protein